MTTSGIALRPVSPGRAGRPIFPSACPRIAASISSSPPPRRDPIDPDPAALASLPAVPPSAMRTPLGRPFTRRPDRSAPRPSPPSAAPAARGRTARSPSSAWSAASAPARALAAAAHGRRRRRSVLDADAVGHALLDQPPRASRSSRGSARRSSTAPGRPATAADGSTAGPWRRSSSPTRPRSGAGGDPPPRMRQTFEKAIARAARKRPGPGRGARRGDPVRGRLARPLRPGRLRGRPARRPPRQRLAAARGWTAERFCGARAGADAAGREARPGRFRPRQRRATRRPWPPRSTPLWDKLVRRPALDPARPRASAAPDRRPIRGRSDPS